MSLWDFIFQISSPRFKTCTTIIWVNIPAHKESFFGERGKLYVDPQKIANMAKPKLTAEYPDTTSTLCIYSQQKIS